MADGRCRPSISFGDKNRVLNTASELNGAEVKQVPPALRLICRYLDVLYGDVATCPRCGYSYVSRSSKERIWDSFELPKTKWRCHYCRETFNVYDYLGSDEPERARFPGVPESISNRLEKATESDGTKQGLDARRDGVRRETNGRNRTF